MLRQRGKSEASAVSGADCASQTTIPAVPTQPLRGPRISTGRLATPRSEHISAP